MMRFAIVALALLCTRNTQASILTFDNCGSSSEVAIGCTGGPVNPVYGSRVSALNADAGGVSTERFYGEEGEGFTPNIVVTYNNALGWNNGFSTLTNVIYVGGTLGIMTVTMQADAGFRARLLGFDLGGFQEVLNNPTEYSGVLITVTDENSNLLFDNGGASYTVGGTTITEVLNIAGSDGGLLRLTLDLRSLPYDPGNGIFDRESVGFDNIRFAQEELPTQPPGNIPEPSTFVLAGGAALLGAWFRIRR